MHAYSHVVRTQDHINTEQESTSKMVHVIIYLSYTIMFEVQSTLTQESKRAQKR